MTDSTHHSGGQVERPDRDAATPPRPSPFRSFGRPSNIEVVIPAFNEELNLTEAIRSVIAWADVVHVVDSQSTDATRAIAAQFGIHCVVQPWLGYAKQKNWALEHLPLRADWVFILDADESITPELRDELLAVAAKPVEAVPESGFYVNRLTYFLGSPIRHCGYFPSYNLRFFKRGKARYEEREVHEHMIVDGPTSRLLHLMNHEDRRGLEHLIAKHNRYSTLEARELTRERMLRRREDAGPLERGIAMRRWLKRNVLPRLPLSGLWRFFYMYVIRLGFLDGLAGLRFCLLLATYDLLISLKLAEIRTMRIDEDAKRLAEEPSKGLAVPEGQVANTPEVVAGGFGAPAAPVAAAPMASAASTVEAKPPSGTDIPLPASGERPTPEPVRPEVGGLVEQLKPHVNIPGRWPACRSVPVSILVPVKNEERNIVECLRRCNWATELVVVDSRSTDGTIALSQAMGADVYQFNYDRKAGWPKKKNWALDRIPWKNEWVMILDADEYMTEELAEEIRKVVTGAWVPTHGARAGCGDGFWVNRRFMFLGRWLKGCGYYPSWNVRLLKHKLGRYERIGNLGDTGSGDNEVHEHIVMSTGDAGYLRHEFLHYAYPDLSAWIEKHNRYTTWEAHAARAGDLGAVNASLFGGPIERRRWIKRFGRKLPLRPTLRFIYSYIFQKGWLDGYAGLVMCRLLAWYEFISIAKAKEMVQQERERANRTV
ncbi:MAG: glycosyltransferase family 2 protein [Phycisphaerae bacterium]